MDFEDDAIESTIDVLYDDILPLYKELHAYVRRKLINQYPENTISETGRIPAHLLGNMWAQSWVNIFDVLKPYPECPDVDADAALTVSPNLLFSTEYA